MKTPTSFHLEDVVVPAIAHSKAQRRALLIEMLGMSDHRMQLLKSIPTAFCPCRITNLRSYSTGQHAKQKRKPWRKIENRMSMYSCMHCV